MGALRPRRTARGDRRCQSQLEKATAGSRIEMEKLEPIPSIGVGSCEDDVKLPAGEFRRKAHYDLSEREQSRIDRIERSIAGSFARLRCIPLRRVRPGHAASVHYGGTFPMSTADEGPLSTDPKGRLRATDSVYLADGSTFPHLPSKGLTFTLMANARRIGEGVGRRLESL